MTYKKPPNLKYTDMAIWIDENAYKEDCNESLLFEYLYHIVNMLAHRGKYYNCAKDYDDFAIYGATKLLLRLRSDRQKLDADRTTRMAKIKSILNFVKRIVYPMKVDFNKSFRDIQGDFTRELVDDAFRGSFLKQYADLLQTTEFNLYAENIGKTIKAYVKKLPYDSKSYQNKLYLSILLTILQRAQFPDTKEAILYNLPSSLNDYVIVHVNKVGRLMADDLAYRGHTVVDVESIYAGLSNFEIPEVSLDES